MDNWHIVFRALGAITALFLLTKMLGKKQIAQLTLFEYMVGITLGDIAGFISTDVEKNYGHGLIALGVWTLIPFGVEWLTLKSKWARDFFEGRGTVIIKDGKILEDNMKKERLNSDELMSQLRSKNAFVAADVEFAVLEANGELSVLLKSDQQPLTPKHLGITVAPVMAPQTVIMDGMILDEPLATAGLSRDWLLTELNSVGVTVDNVYLAQVDGYQQLYIDVFDDKLSIPLPQTKLLVFTTLKKCAADLELFALGTNNKQAKLAYSESVMTMDRVLTIMEPVLKR